MCPYRESCHSLCCTCSSSTGPTVVLLVWYCLWKRKIICTRRRKKAEENLDGDDRRDPGGVTVEMKSQENGCGEGHAVNFIPSFTPLLYSFLNGSLLFLPGCRLYQY